MQTPSSTNHCPDFDIASSCLPPGLSAIEASAGTGKTYAISHLVPRLLLEGTVSRLSEILLVTFTNAAARELSERTRQVLVSLARPPEADEATQSPVLAQLRAKCPDSREKIAKALLEIDQLDISTIHSFCQKVLQSHGTLCGFPAPPELIPDASRDQDLALYDLWQAEIVSNPDLSAFVIAHGWVPSGDMEILKKTLSLADYEPVPPVRPFADAFQEAAAFRFSEEEIEDLRSFFEEVPKWNKDAGTPETREQYLVALEAQEGSGICDPLFCAATAWLQNLPSYIAARSGEGKAKKEKAEGLEAVKSAKKIQSALSLLRWHWQHHCAAKIKEKIHLSLKEKRQITYDGLIRHLHAALHSENGDTLCELLRKRYKVALIDESQDTDPEQFEIFQKIFLGSDEQRLILIGDPKQAIYGFRSADLNTYLEAKKQAKFVYSLTKTYRSPTPLVNGINTLFECENAFVNSGIQFTPATSGLPGEFPRLLDASESPFAPVHVWLVPPKEVENYGNADKRNAEILPRMVSEILRLLDGGKIQTGESESRAVCPGDIAVLVGKNAEAADFAAALKARNIPAVIASEGTIFASEEAKHLLGLLRALISPRNKKLRFAALATPFLGRTAEEIFAIRNDFEKEEKWLDQFSKWQETWEQQGIAAAISQIDRDEKISQRLACGRKPERALTNFRQLCDLLQSASTSSHLRPGQLLVWFEQQMVSPEVTQNDDLEIQLESDAEAVQVLTIHKSKGLEFPIVFCPYLWNGKTGKTVGTLRKSDPRNPSRSDKIVDASLADTQQNSTFAEIFQASTLEESLRLAYVALTRAKVAVYFLCGGIGMSRPTPSSLDWLFRGDSAPNTCSEWLETRPEKNRMTLHETFFSKLRTLENFRISPPPEANDDPFVSQKEAEKPALTCLPAPVIPKPWTVTSFSSLTREAHAHGGTDFSSPKDMKDLPTTGEQSFSGSTLGAKMPSDAAPTEFLRCPRGSLVGSFVHEWIETWDFSEISEESCDSIQKHASKFHVQTGERQVPLETAMPSLLSALRLAEFPGMGKLHEICSQASASEWHFHLPLKTAFSPSDLAGIFSKHGFCEYGEALQELGSSTIEGFLQGFIDRLAVSGNTWGVIDWKTNALGEDIDAYTESSMLRCAIHSHYFLQVHLYLVALRRYLRSFCVEPAPVLGGAALVFLRGIRTDGSGGVLHFNPSSALLDDLDHLFS